MLWWQGPTLLNPHFAVGTKDQDGSRLFYEPLAGWDADGNLRPVLAAAIPGREDGTLAADGKSVTWKLKQGVTWHDGKPFTADDVVFTWEYAKDPATAAVTIGTYKDVVVEKIDDYTVAVKFDKPTPFWADAFVGARGMIIPKHLFADYIGAKSRDAPTNLKPVGTGPYKFKDFKPGDMVAGVINTELPRGEPALFRRDRDEGRRRRGLGGARGAADRRVRLRLEHAGRGRDPAAPREGRQGPRRHHRRRRHRAHPAQHHRSVDRGRRRARRASRPSIRRCQRSGGAPGAGAAGRQRLGREVHLRPHRHRDARTSSTTRRRFRSKNTKFEFNIDKANDILEKAGWKKGADGIRAKDGKKLKFVFQTSINQPRQKTQAIVKQACQKAGIDIELKAVTASVFFSSDVANPDTYPHFYCDLQMYTTTMTQPDPELFMRQFLLVGGGDQGEQVAGPQHHALAERGIRRHLQGRPERARSGQARRAASSRLNDLVVNDQVVIPVVARPGVAARQQQARRPTERLGQQHLGPPGLVQGGAEATLGPR